VTRQERLDAIADEIRDHLPCGFEPCETCATFVPGEGNPDARIVLVGEAPGANEDRLGRPFVGAAGKFLDTLLGEAGLRREDVFITNVLKSRPPGNRDPKPEEVAACIPYLFRQIELINPRSRFSGEAPVRRGNDASQRPHTERTSVRGRRGRTSDQGCGRCPCPSRGRPWRRRDGWRAPRLVRGQSGNRGLGRSELCRPAGHHDSDRVRHLGA